MRPQPVDRIARLLTRLQVAQAEHVRTRIARRDFRLKQPFLLLRRAVVDTQVVHEFVPHLGFRGDDLIRKKPQLTIELWRLKVEIFGLYDKYGDLYDQCEVILSYLPDEP